MTPAKTLTANRTWSPDVLTFAAERVITEYLPRLLEITERIYPNRLTYVYLDEAPVTTDDPFRRHSIIFVIDCTHLTVQYVGTTYGRWMEELRSIYPSPLPDLFHLDFVELI
jgi:hypothetical protein